MAVKFTKPEINVREKLAELDKPSGIAGEAMLRAETPQEQFNLMGAGRRNLIINGDFQVSQRGDYSSAGTATNGHYFVDRFRTFFTGVTATVQRTSNSPPNTHTGHSLKITATSSGTGYIDLLQYVEYQPYFVGKQMTLSSWVRSNNKDTQFRVTAGAQIATKNHSGGGEWEYLTLTFIYPTTVATNIGIEILAYDNGNVPIVNGDFVEIANLQLELGKVATPFEHRSYGEELALCQRYYYRITNSHAVNQNLCMGVVADTDDVFGVMDMPVTMRVPPSVTASAAASFRVTTIFGSGGSQNCSQLVLGYDGQAHVTIKARGNGGGFTAGQAKLIGFNETIGLAYIEFDAEL
jgi:hypothetical protein